MNKKPDKKKSSKKDETSKQKKVTGKESVKTKEGTGIAGTQLGTDDPTPAKGKETTRQVRGLG